MKYLKQFEEQKTKLPLNHDIEIHDYVIIKKLSKRRFLLEDLNNFLLNNIGYILWIDKRKEVNDRRYLIEYANVPNELKEHFTESENGLIYFDTIIGKYYGSELKKITNKIKIEEFNIEKMAAKYNL